MASIPQQQPHLLKQLKQTLIELTTLEESKKVNQITLKKQLKQLLEKKEFYKKENIIQEKKYKSLNLLVTELQTTLENLQLQIKTKQFDLEDNNISSKITLENQILRHCLIKKTEQCKESEQLYSFLKQLKTNKNNLNSFISKSNFIQNQTQILAKLRSNCGRFNNENMECRRKWRLLKQQKDKNEKQVSILKIQVQRQKQLLKSIYEQYLQKTNKTKTRIVNFNETQRQKLLTDYLVEEVALLQEKRVQIQEQNKNLQFHLQGLLQEHERNILQNGELNGFFLNETNKQESRLAMKMKARIEELTDSLLEAKKKGEENSMKEKMQENLKFIRQKLGKIKEGGDFLQLKLRGIEMGKFSYLDEKQVSQYFSAILREKDDIVEAKRQRVRTLKDEVKELQMKSLLLEGQVNNLQQVFQQNDYEAEYKRRQLDQ